MGWRTPFLRQHLRCPRAGSLRGERCPLKKCGCCRCDAGSVGAQGPASASFGVCEDPGALAVTEFCREMVEAVTRGCDFPVSSVHTMQTPGVSSEF